jgi:hypothetical protein
MDGSYSSRAATTRDDWSSRFHGYGEGRSEVEVGWILLARPYRGGSYNAEMKRLMLEYPVRLVNSLWFLVDSQNVCCNGPWRRSAPFARDRERKRPAEAAMSTKSAPRLSHSGEGQYRSPNQRPTWRFVVSIGFDGSFAR